MAIINLLQHITYVHDHLACVQRHFLCPISALKMCTFSAVRHTFSADEWWVGEENRSSNYITSATSSRGCTEAFVRSLQTISGTSSRCATLETRTVLHHMGRWRCRAWKGVIVGCYAYLKRLEGVPLVPSKISLTKLFASLARSALLYFVCCTRKRKKKIKRIRYYYKIAFLHPRTLIAPDPFYYELVIKWQIP